MPDCNLSGDPPYNCEGCDLSNKSFAGKNMKNANLKKAILKGASFVGVTSMEGAKLDGAMMGSGTDFTGVDLSGIVCDTMPDFGKEETLRANFTKAKVPFKLIGKAWNYLNLSEATLIDAPANLSRLTVRNSNLFKLNLSEKDLSGARFFASKLEKINLFKANLTNAVFTDQTELKDANLSAAVLQTTTFDRSLLIRTNFTEAVFTKTSFLNARMDGALFNKTDVTSCVFSEPAIFSRDPLNITSFQGTKILAQTLNKDWSYLDLRGVKFAGLDPKADLSNLLANYSNLSEDPASPNTTYTFEAATLNGANFSGARLNKTNFKGAKISNANFRGVQGELTNFSGATLTNTSFSPLPLALKPEEKVPTQLLAADFSNATLNSAKFPGARLGPITKADNTKVYTTFSRARMENIDMSNADLTGAKLTGDIRLYGSNFTGAILQEADLTGAHMGEFNTLFSVTATAEYSQFNDELNSTNYTFIQSKFAEEKRAIIISSIITEISNHSWTIKAKLPDRDVEYTVLKRESADHAFSFDVSSKEARAVILSGADLRDAKLINTDLRGVSADGVHLCGSDTKLSGALMHRIILNDAHMADTDLTDAKLYDANLVGANLTGAKLNNAKLRKAKLGKAWLQGAKFPDSDLFATELNNAAVSVPVTPQKAGVYLNVFSKTSPLDPKKPEEFDKLMAEIGKFAKFVAVSNRSGEAEDILNDNKLTGLRFLTPDTLSFPASATVIKETEKNAWRIKANEDTIYLAWCGEYRSATESFLDVIFIREEPAPQLKKLFEQGLGLSLRKHFSVLPLASSANTWELDNDAEKNPDVGHTVFYLVKQASGALAVYATAMRMIEKNDKGIPRLITQTFLPTQLCSQASQGDCNPYTSSTYLTDETQCPNARLYSENKKDEVTWADMLRANITPKKS